MTVHAAQQHDGACIPRSRAALEAGCREGDRPLGPGQPGDGREAADLAPAVIPSTGARQVLGACKLGHRAKRGSRGGRPVSYDAQDYKQRNVIERAFNRLKQWRGIATRYDKHALVYRGAVVLASILLWLR